MASRGATSTSIGRRGSSGSARRPTSAKVSSGRSRGTAKTQPRMLRPDAGAVRDRVVRLSQLAADRPLHVLAGLVAVQWLALLAFALTVRHNGLVYYQGGDQIGLTTDAWLLAHGHLPPAVLGFGWPFLLLPFGWIAASDYVSFLPYVIGLNVLVLGPVALACVYGLVSRIGGRLLGLWAS